MFTTIRNLREVRTMYSLEYKQLYIVAVEQFKNAVAGFIVIASKSIENMAIGLQDAFAEIAKNFYPTVKELGYVLTAYAEAKEEHPRWVHMANYSKKKRIRKKYHDRIMRTYGKREAENE